MSILPYTGSAANRSAIASSPFYPNVTSQKGYGTGTLNFAREGRPTETATAFSTGKGTQYGISFITLLLSLMVGTLVL